MSILAACQEYLRIDPHKKRSGLVVSAENHNSQTQVTGDGFFLSLSGTHSYIDDKSSFTLIKKLFLHSILQKRKTWLTFFKILFSLLPRFNLIYSSPGIFFKF